jgi:ankyrin repeat protein
MALKMNIETELLAIIERTVEERDLKEVRRILRAYPYLFHFEIPHGWPVLHRCMDNACADLQLAKMFLAAGGDVNRKTNSGVSLLFLACAHACGEETPSYLRTQGARMSNFEEAVVALTSGISEEQETTAIRRLVDVEPGIVRQRGDNGFTLLHWTMSEGSNPDVVRLLLERGADATAITYTGKSVLGSRNYSEPEEMACFELVASKGAKYTQVEQFIRWIRDDEDEEVIKILKKQPILRNAWCPGDRGASGSLLHTAVWFGKGDRLVLIKYLLEHGMDPNLPNEVGETALHRVMHRVSGSLIHDPNDPRIVSEATRANQTCRRARLALIDLLLQHGANINQQDERGYTPLHEAAALNEEEAVKLLVERGAAINAKTNEGRTVLDIVYAIPYIGHRSLGHWLKSQGACSGKPK